MEKEIDVERMKKCLLNETEETFINKQIKSKLHDMYVIETEKIGLNPFDDKRFYLNNIENKPYGY